MDNATRRRLLQQHRQSGYTGSILDVYKAYDQGIDLLGQFEQKNNVDVAETPQQFKQGLRPAHQAGDINKSMVFPNVPPNTPFNTVGMKAPINIQKFDEQGHLVKSYENVPPGIKSLPMGPHQGTVLETPAQMQSGGVRKYQLAGPIDNTAVATPPSPQYQLNPLPQTPYKDQGTIRPIPRHLDYETWRDEDSLLENALEFIDPTGITSWDDARRAYNSMQERGASYPNFDEALDMFGALPLVGKFKRGINLGKGAAKRIGDIKNLGASAYNALTRGADVINRVDAIEDETGFLDSKRTGGVRKYQGAGQLDTLYVNSPTDPRIQQYADSLGAYNFGQKKYNEAIRHVDSLIANYNSNPSAAVQNDPVRRKVDFAPHDPAGRYANFKYNGLTPYQDVTITPVGSQGPIMLPQSQGFFLEASQPLWAKPKQPVVFRPSPQPLNPIELSQINQSQPIPSLQTGYKSTTRTRPSQTIYKQDPTVSTGQYPIGENMWDPNKKQWFRSMFDKEMQDTFRQNAKPRREKWRTIETPPGGFLTGGVKKYQTGTPPLFGIDSELLKVGVAGTESSGGVNMMNPGSTATGLYGQRFSEIKDSYPGTREEFSTNIAAQDSIFDRRLYQGLNDERSMLNHLQHMYENYPDQIAEKGYTSEQLAGIINMLGREGTRQYLGYVVRDKRDLAEVFPDKYGPDVPEDKKNKTPDEYAQTMQWWMDRYAEDNCPGGECMKTTQKMGGKLGIKRYFKLRK